MIEFSPISSDELNYYKDYLLESIIESIRLAKAAGRKALQYKIEAESSLIKLLRFDKKDAPVYPYQTNHVIHITNDPEAIGLPKIKNKEAIIKSLQSY